MAREKFERNKTHVNIGTIGHLDYGIKPLKDSIKSTVEVVKEVQ